METFELETLQKILPVLGLSDFVALDIETTGLEYQKEDIIEFGAVRFQNGVPTERLSQLIRPTKTIPENIQRITGISNEDVQEAPPFSEVVDAILQFVGSRPLVVHNVRFDLPFLEYHVRKAKEGHLFWDERDIQYQYFPNQKLDTVLLARMYFYFLPGFSLNQVAQFFGIENPQAHRALADAEIAGQVFLHLVHKALQTPFKDVQRILKILEGTDNPIKWFFEQLAIALASGDVSVEGGLDSATVALESFYNIIGEDVIPGPPSLKTELIDEEAIAAFFEEGGPLQQELGKYEVREPQVAMARAVARALNEGQFLVVEAGTGTGKSLAYLVPAIHWATKNYGPAGRMIISTNTKNLQEQLFFKDLPVLKNILNIPFKAVLLKGKANYLCLDKWYSILNDLNIRLTTDERSKMLPLYFWVQHTKTGDIAENNAFRADRNISLWSKFIAENNYCPGRSCKYYNDCFLWKARNHAAQAHLVFVNHSLLFADLAAGNAILADYQNVIFDEAHNIEKTATEYLGTSVNIWEFREVYRRLYLKEKRELGILVQLKQRLRYAEIEKTHQKNLEKFVVDLIVKVTTGWPMTQNLFRSLLSYIKQQIDTTVNDKGENNSVRKIRYTRADNFLDAIAPLFEEWKTEFSAFIKQLNDLIEYFKELPEDVLPSQKQIIQELNAQFAQATILKENLEFLLTAEWDNFVYWLELPYRAESDDLRLYAAPLDVASVLSQRLYSNLRSGIFTSATLAVNKSLDYFKKRVGLNFVEPERLEMLLLDSPFNYQEQVLLIVPGFFPEPRHPSFRILLKDFFRKLLKYHPRGTLALFTSYTLLNELYYDLKLDFQSNNVTLLGQRIDGSRHTLITRFKAEKNSFLFGTDSFWEGIDVPGEALEILLITKLPFDVPSEPIIQAKIERIEREGGNPFMEFTVPEAIIRFRQGFGRLIRSKDDYGAIIILDTRVVRKMYGRMFLQSLPVQARVFPEENDFWQAIARWFGTLAE